MLGNITVKREELKIKDFDRYQGFYCGVCNDLKKNCGELSRLTLTYDMTFLAILLTSLYEPETSSEYIRCAFHPGAKKLCCRNTYTAYAADMSLIMVYHNLLDDWRDEKKQKSLLESRLLLRAYKKAGAKYPAQLKSLKTYLKRLHKAEEEAKADLDLASGLTGDFFRSVFVYDPEDIWSRDLGTIGFYLGKYIYLLDAYEDLDADKKSGNYNPLISVSSRDDFDAYVKDILTMMAAQAAAAFERLPIVENAEILRNILYAGIWNKYIEIKNKREKK